MLCGSIILPNERSDEAFETLGHLAVIRKNKPYTAAKDIVAVAFALHADEVVF